MKITRRRALLGALSTAVATKAAKAHDLFRHRGHPRATSQWLDVSTFSLTEHTGISSVGFKRGGICLTRGVVPNTWRIAIRRADNSIVDADFNNQATVWNGSDWQFMTFCMRDTAFAPNETRNYKISAIQGSFVNTPGITLSTALAGTDFKVRFSNITGFTSGAQNNQTATLNLHAQVPTRITQYESGSVCVSWRIWGMAVDDITGTAHPHLKTVWYVSAWLNANGTLADIEIMPVICLNWWSIAGKEKLTYDALFQNGAATITSYTTVEHPYMMTWAMVRSTNDNEHAIRPWISGAHPTLLYIPNKLDWRASQLVPPYNKVIAFAEPPSYAAVNTYVPGSCFSHTADVEQPGDYNGRGIIPVTCAILFNTPTAANARVARVNWFAGLHLPMHRRSNRTRVRPQDNGVADIADTAVSNIIWDARSTATPLSYSDFTADGLPTPVHAYSDGRTNPIYQDSYVQPTGGTVSGSTIWKNTENNTHAANYCYFGYLYSGERYFWEATLDHTVDTYQGLIGAPTGVMGTLNWWWGFTNTALYPGATNTQWAPTPLHTTPLSNIRGLAWPINLLASMVVTPDNDEHINYLKRIVLVNGQWLKATVDLIPSGIPGTWSPMGPYTEPPWQDAFAIICASTMYLRILDTNWMPIVEYLTQTPMMYYNNNILSNSMAYQLVTRVDQSKNWDPVTNPYYSEGPYPMQDAVPLNASTDRITFSSTVQGPLFGLNPTNGDVIYFNTVHANGFTAVVPPEVTIGTKYYVANVSGLTFQVSRTPDGSDIVTFASDVAAGESNGVGMVLGYRYQDPAYNTPISGGWQGGMITAAAVIIARRAGSTRVTQAAVDAYITYYANPRTDPNWPQWNFDVL